MYVSVLQKQSSGLIEECVWNLKLYEVQLKIKIMHATEKGERLFLKIVV